jgi:hypothetical protein
VINKLKVIGFVYIMNLGALGLADSPGLLRPSSVVFDYKDREITIKATTSVIENIMEIRISIRGEETVIKGDDVFDFKNPDLAKIEVRSLAPVGEDPNGDGSLWVSLPSFDIRVHGSSEKSVDVVGRLELTFESGKLTTVDVDTPLGDYKNKWLVKGYGIRNGKKIFFKNETIESIDEP